MAVMLANAQLRVRVRAHPQGRDAHGVPIPGDPADDVVRGPFPGLTAEQPDGSWKLQLDPRHHPVEPGDVVVDEDDREWTITTERPVLQRVPGAPMLDFIPITGTLNVPVTP